MIDKNSLPYRPCVGIVLLNAEGHVFVGERLDNLGAWQFPQGGIDPGEDIETALWRELMEETGTDKAELLRVSEETTRYDLPNHLIGQLWNGAFRGQEQHWAALRFTGEDAHIDINSFDPPEFNAWKWVALDQTLDLIVPFKRETYEKVIAMFEDLI